MCLAFTYKIEKYDKKTRKAIVGLDGVHREVLNAYKLDLKEGDNVTVQMGIVISKISKEEAKIALKLGSKKGSPL